MKMNTRILCLKLLLFVLFVPSCSDQEKPPTSHDSKPPPRQESKSPKSSFIKEYDFSDDHKGLVFIGLPQNESDQFWRDAGEEVKNSPYRLKVRSILLSQCFVDASALLCLSNFSETETMTFGPSFEGVTILPHDLAALAAFPKLRYLELAVHGISAEHFAEIARLSQITDLRIDFPSIHMLRGRVHDRQRAVWKAVDLTDASVAPLAGMRGLEDLTFGRAPESRDGKVRFSEQVIPLLLKSPSIKFLTIEPSNFTPAGLAAARNMKLSPVVELR